MIGTKFYAYKDKRTGEYMSYEPYRAKSPATSGLYDHIKYHEKLEGTEGRWPDKEDIKAYAQEHYELEVLELLPVAEVKSLKDDAKFLLKLQDAGVDNWEGYHYAFQDDEED